MNFCVTRESKSLDTALIIYGFFISYSALGVGVIGIGGWRGGMVGGQLIIIVCIYPYHNTR